MDQALKDALDRVIGPTLAPALIQFGVGVGLMYSVGEFFKFVEERLPEDTKLKIAVWLLDREKLSPTLQRWPDTFAEVFDQLFGKEHLTWRCFRRSCLVSACGVVLMFVLRAARHPTQLVDYLRLSSHPFIEFIVPFVVISAMPDYISLLKSRFLIKLMGKVNAIAIPSLIVVDFVLTLSIAIGGYLLYIFTFITPEHIRDDVKILFEGPNLNANPGYAPLSALLYPAFFTTLWVTLYGTAGLLLKFAKRLGSWLSWFNRHFDIEKKPLQSIGGLAGALVAICWWTLVIVRHFV